MRTRNQFRPQNIKFHSTKSETFKSASDDVLRHAECLVQLKANGSTNTTTINRNVNAVGANAQSTARGAAKSLGCRYVYSPQSPRYLQEPDM